MSAPLLTVGSLFAGIGGFELGLEQTGHFRTVWQVERDPYCQRVLAQHWPDAVRYDDVCTVGADTLAPVDVICGGFPCQDISYAGKGDGLAGERSGLWFEFARIIRELRPRYVLVENVAALLTRGIGDVLGSLAALGYDAEWSVLSAADVGAPHRRERVFIVAHADGGCVRDCDTVGGDGRPLSRQGAQWLLRRSSRGTHVADAALSVRRARRSGRSDSGCARESVTVGALSHVADPERGGPQGGVLQRPQSSTVVAPAVSGDCGGRHVWRPWDVEPGVGRLVDGLSREVVEQSLRALGNAIVPQCAEFVGWRLLDLIGCECAVCAERAA